MPDTATNPFSLPRWALGIVLAILAFTGNVVHVPLFFGVDYLFGSIAALLAAVWLGPLAGMVVAAIGALYTLELWGHPWALVTFSLEAGVVGLLYRRFGELVLADILFWVVGGLPVIFLVSSGALDIGWESARLIALKQPVNGVFNALVAVLILYWISRARVIATFQQLAFNVLFGSLFTVGLVLIVVFTQTLHIVQEDLVGELLRDRQSSVVREMQDILSEPEGGGAVDNAQLATDLDVGLRLPDGDLIAAQGLPAWIDEADAQARSNGLTIRLPPDARGLPAMERWASGYYTIEAPLPGLNGVSAVVLAQSARPVMEHLARANTYAHGLLVAVGLLGGVCAWFLAAGMVRPFRRLEETVRGLPERIENGQQLELPDTSVREARQLGDGFQEMAERLEQTVGDLAANQAELEQQVRERTRSLAEANEALQARKSRLRRLAEVLNATPDFVAVSRSDGAVVYVNNGGRQLLGLPEMSLSDTEFVLDPIPSSAFSGSWGHPEWADRVVREEGIPTAVATGHWEGETALVDVHGHEIPVSQRIIAHYDDQGDIFQMSTIMRDIRRNKELEAELAHQASHDPLTGIYNRQQYDLLLDQEMGRAERYATPFSLIMLDIDHFKAVNDSLGHDVGDAVLITLTDVLKARLRTADIVARWGGEEFMLLLPETTEAKAANVAETLRTALSETDFPCPGGITISAGVAGYRSGESQSVLTKRLDDALYRAKENGRDQVARASAVSAP